MEPEVARRTGRWGSASALGIPLLFLTPFASACAPRAVTCSRACDAPFVCATGGCVAPATIPAIEAHDRLGYPQVRRLVVPAVDVARLAPGDARAEIPRAAVLARDRDTRAVLLLRFALALPPGTTIVEAHLVLDRAQAIDSDPAPVTLHAVRVASPWDSGSVTWGRLPRLDDIQLPATTLDDARGELRLDVRPLVRAWRLHDPRDQGIAVVADRTSATGAAFALADGEAPDQAPLPTPVRPSSPPPVFTGAESAESAIPPPPPRGPRLELYVKP